LFVGRLSWNVDDDWLKREFEEIGEIVSARIVFDKHSGKSKGFGYVDFADASSAQKAIDELQGKEIDGRPVNLDLSTAKPAENNSSNRNTRAEKFGDKLSEPSDTLFLGNLSFSVDRDSLFEVFGAHGNVLNVRLPTNPETEQLKGFGYVQFASADEAKAALEALNGSPISGRPVRLDYSTPRDNSGGGRGGARGGRGGNRGGSRGDRGGGRGDRGGGRGDRGGSRGGRGGRGGPRGGRTGANAVEFKGKKITF
ncbi:RNA-binding domain-containing protein, partial [Lipomyces tetrasporus]